MYKKSILCLAVASSLTLSGCLSKNPPSTNNANPTPIISSAYNPNNYVFPVFNPATNQLPIPNDLIFDQTQKDGTFGVTPDPSNPVITALNELSGASTVAPIDIKMSGFVDPSTVNGTEVVMNGATPIPNPAQTVFLLELKYASGDPLTGLSDSEIPTVWNAVRFGAASGDPASIALYPGKQAQAVADLVALAAAPAYEAQVREFDGTSYIRINPIKPLNPRKRYVVVVTNGVKDMQGNPIIQSASYKNLTDANLPLASSSLAPVRSAINGLWEATADGYFSKVANNVRPTAPLSDANIAMSFSLTTSDDVKVPLYIAEPGLWVKDRVTDLVKNKAVQAALAGGAADFGALYTAAQTAYMSWLPSSLNAALAACDAAPAGDARFSCAGTNLIAGLKAGAFGAFPPFPDPQAVTTTFGTPKDADQVSALIASTGVPAGTVSVVEGTMTIPYYLGVPNSTTDGSPLVTQHWVADSTLAAALNTVFASAGLSIPQADPNVSTAVNYIFPFPKKTKDVTIPVLGIFPTTPAGLMTPVIFQHGITTDRSAALVYGANMVAGAKAASKDVAIIAIDQPLHGIAPISDAARLVLAQNLLTAAGQDPATAQANAQAVVDGTFSTGLLKQVDAVCTAITVDYTNPTDIANKKLTVAGGICDAAVGGAANGSKAMGSALVLEHTVADGGSTIPGMAATPNERDFNFTADASNMPTPMIFDKINAFGSSGSLFINLGNFLTTRDNLREQILDLLTLRLSLPTVDFNGGGADLDVSKTFYIGHSLGTLNGIPFVAVANETTTTADNITAANMLTPGGGIVRLVENSPSFAPTVLTGIQAASGLVQGDGALESFFNILQAAVDTSDPVNFVQKYTSLPIPVLFSEVVGDTTIPNNAWPNAVSIPGFSPSPSPLAGTDPLIRLTNAGTIKSGANALTQNVVRYTAGVHGTPVFPLSGTASEKAVFAEMIGESTSMVLSGGTGITITDTTYVKQ